ncbi:MAG: nucleotidyltransferase domain-containing protein [Candidatus Cloacimonadales bacterium]|nr:nucleotidyltransferase domain-containing protein [Candidatus Cloacimonadales bacterium]
MKFGLKIRDIDNIIKAIREFPEIEKIVIFGSRAMGNFKNGSDVDLAVFGNDVTDVTIKRFSDLLNEELPLPYFFDVVDFNSISNSDLIEHIEEEGKIFFVMNKKGK